MKRYILLIGALAAYLWALLAQASSPLESRVYEMPLSVEEVKTLGVWNKGSEIGYYRFIVTKEQTRYKKHHFWVQWICDCDRGRVSMVGIKELNDYEPYQLESTPVFKVAEHRGYLQFNVKDARTRIKKRVQLDVTEPGVYKILSQTVREQPET